MSLSESDAVNRVADALGPEETSGFLFDYCACASHLLTNAQTETAGTAKSAHVAAIAPSAIYI